MSTRGGRDTEMDRLLRTEVGPAGARVSRESSATPCPSAGELAAFADATLDAAERDALETHVSTCDRCQDVLAAMAVMPAEAAEHVRPVQHPLAWLRWAVPATAVAAAALVLYVVVGPSHTTEIMSVTRSASPFSSAPAADRPGATPGAPEPQQRAATSATPEEKRGREPMPGGAQTARESRRQAAAENNPRKVMAGSAGGGAAAALPSDAASFAAPAPGAAAPSRMVNAMQMADKAAPAAPSRAGMAPPSAMPVAASRPTPPSPEKVEVRAADAGKPEMAARGGGGRSAGFLAGGVAGSVADRSRPGFRTEPAFTMVVMAADSRVVWRFDPTGRVSRSEDAGASWQLQRNGPPLELLAGSAPSATVCWAVGRSGAMLVTADGAHWDTRTFVEPVDLVGVEARDAGNATVTTRDGRSFTTRDGGLTWGAGK